ncbi:manganese efflux pump MntP [Halanaerobaculum tunisiense]
MGSYEVVLVALAIGMDSFSLSIGLGVSGIKNNKKILKFSLVVAVLHFLLPVIGLYLGSQLSHYLGQVANYLGAGVLLFLGFNMMKEDDQITRDFSLTGTGLILLSLSVSLDALTVGLGLGALGARMIQVAIFFGAVAFLLTIVGITIGDAVGRVVAKLQFVGGLILLGLGVKLLAF